MTMIWSIRFVALAAVALLAAPLAVSAQPAQAPTPAAPPAATSSAPAPNSPEARVEARIKDLHAKLHITAAQEAQWDQFAQIMRANARDMGQELQQRAQQFPSMNAVQDLKSYEQLAEGHVQRLQKLIPAFEALYNAMPDQQKQLADQVFRATAAQRAQTRAGGGRPADKLDTLIEIKTAVPAQVLTHWAASPIFNVDPGLRRDDIINPSPCLRGEFFLLTI